VGCRFESCWDRQYQNFPFALKPLICRAAKARTKAISVIRQLKKLLAIAVAHAPSLFVLFVDAAIIGMPRCKPTRCAVRREAWIATRLVTGSISPCAAHKAVL
jgi:hypothetical protein